MLLSGQLLTWFSLVGSTLAVVVVQIQWNLLMEQQAANVWRKQAFGALKAAHDQYGKDGVGSDRLLSCLDTFRERVDHNVENTVPVGQVETCAFVACLLCVSFSSNCNEDLHRVE